MALEKGSKKSISYGQEVTPTFFNNKVEAGDQNEILPTNISSRYFKALLASFIIIVLALIIIIVPWYFTDHKVWTMESRVLQHYIFAVQNVDRNFSSDLSSPDNPAFQEEAKIVEDLVEKIMKDSSMSRYFNGTTAFSFVDGEMSIMAHLWINMSVPESHVQSVTESTVTESLKEVIEKHILFFDLALIYGFFFYLPSVYVIECFYEYNGVSSSPITLSEPKIDSSSCIWRLKATPGTLLELHIQRMLPECWDSLTVYNSQMPANVELMTGLFGCNALEPERHVLSSDETMTVLWEKNTYGYPTYYNAFSLSVRSRVPQGCNSTIQLKAESGVQGTLRTPFFPSYYPPYTNCSWTFTIPGKGLGLSLEFEGYELVEVDDDETCARGDWFIQDKRFCGIDIKQPYFQRLPKVSKPVSVVMISDVAITGPGLQLHYSVYNLSDPCPGQFLCTINGLCVSACDGITDCPNGLDERNCVCVAQFQCPGRFQCVDYDKVCDELENCPEGTDETNCTDAVQCTDVTYRCADGTCLKKPNPECDSVTDCPDASDEENCDCGMRPFSSRIVGGVDAREGAWPWQVSLFLGSTHKCGGVLINNQWVASAAHCFTRTRPASMWTVYLGKHLLDESSPTEEEVYVKQIYVHDYYDDTTTDYDLALLKLDRNASMPLPESCQRICLPPPTHRFDPGRVCYVTGWGTLRESGYLSNVLQEVDINIVSEETCVRTYGGDVSPRMLCAGNRRGGKDACQGDSGGPLVCQEESGRWFLAGIVSWGIGCGQPRFWGVYTRVTKQTDWIKRVISTNSDTIVNNE